MSAFSSAAYEYATEAAYQFRLASGDAHAESVDAILAEMVEGDDLLDVVGFWSPDDQAEWDVALLRWLRGDVMALEQVRAMVMDRMRERAEAVVAQRETQA